MAGSWPGDPAEVIEYRGAILRELAVGVTACFTMADDSKALVAELRRIALMNQVPSRLCHLIGTNLIHPMF